MITINQINQEVANYFAMDPVELKRKCNGVKKRYARAIAITLAREFTKATYKSLAAIYCLDVSATHGRCVFVHDQLAVNNKDVREAIAAIVRNLK